MPFIKDIRFLPLKSCIEGCIRIPTPCKSGTIRPPFLLKLLLLPVFLVLFTFCETLSAASNQPVAQISEIRKIIVEKALHPPSAESLAQLSMDHLAEKLRALDSHALYVPPSLSIQKSSLRIGLDIFAYKSRIWVMPEPEGPAGEQGVPEVGELRGVNNVRITNNLEQTSTIIDNAIKNNSVLLDIHDISDGQNKKFTIRPATYKTSSVTTRKVGKYVFIRISDFVSHETAPFFSGLYNTIYSSGASIIIDLRGCPGGDLFEALEIAGMFVPAGVQLITTYDRTGKIHSYTSPAGLKLSRPVCILMDNRTASAAEILAGILQTKSITRLVGERSYGKCESQTIFNLSDGGKLWLTTLSIHFPDDTSCTQNGIKPDVIYPDISIARLTSIKDILPKNEQN
jgi:carboxyl-terminal processing protease